MAQSWGSEYSLFFKEIGSFHGISRISSITKENGTRILKQGEVKEEMIGYFSRLWSQSPPHIDRDILEDTFSANLSPSQQ